MKKNTYIIKCFILGILTSLALIAELSIKKVVIFTRLNNDSFSLLIMGLFFIWFYNKYLKDNKKNKVFQVLSALFSILMVVGYSYDVVGNATLINGTLPLIIASILKLVAFYNMFNTALNLLYKTIINSNIKNSKPISKLSKLFDEHPFKFSFIVIALCYLPYLIAFYPGVMCYDPANQIREVMGMHTRYMDSVVLLDPSMTITNFNPIIHTLLIGGCFKLGYEIGNVNIGLFLYTIIQTIILISALSYSIYYMKKEGIANKLLYIALVVFALVPVFPFYAVATVKDTIFSALLLLYIIKLYDIIRHNQNTKDYVYLFIISLLVILFRNNGIYTILLSMPFLLLSVKDKRKPIVVTLITLIACHVGYGKVLLPTLKISNTSVREVLSIPFQQTARLVKYHGDNIKAKDVEIIDNLLIYDTLGERYVPYISDPVKNLYNKEATGEDLKNYFEVWFKYLWKYPVVYVDATISNIYGYFYPNTSKWYFYSDYNTKLEEAGFDYSYNNLDEFRRTLSHIAYNYPYVPVIGMFLNIGFIVWIYFISVGILLVNKKAKYITVLLPALSLILVCVASPVNTYFRYAQPFIFSLPVVLFLLYEILDKEKKKYSK
jgi:hypothetical protein